MRWPWRVQRRRTNHSQPGRCGELKHKTAVWQGYGLIEPFRLRPAWGQCSAPSDGRDAFDWQRRGGPPDESRLAVPNLTNPLGCGQANFRMPTIRQGSVITMIYIKAITPLRSRTICPPRGPRCAACAADIESPNFAPGIPVRMAAAPNQPLVSTILPSTEPEARSSRACLASRSGNVRLTRGSIFFAARSVKILGRSSRNGLASLRYRLVMP